MTESTIEKEIKPHPLSVRNLAHFIHERFLAVLLLVYVLAACAPQLGLLLRAMHFGQVDFLGSSIQFNLSMLFLSIILFNAGIGIKLSELKGLINHPLTIVAGFVANSAVPLTILLAFLGFAKFWHNPEEIQIILVGMAMYVSMPIAGSSAAWSQNANGNMSLSLGLVLLSTILSPFTTPLILSVFGNITVGDYAQLLKGLATNGTNAFMMWTVVLPSFLGIIAHFVIGENRTASLKFHLKLTNFLLLLSLNYINASSSLPEAIANPNWGFLTLSFATAWIFCLTAFGAGWILAKCFKANKSDQAALMFALGMNNNATGLVLASATLSGHSAVLLPVIFATLAQQVSAALIDWKVFRSED